MLHMPYNQYVTLSAVPHLLPLRSEPVAPLKYRERFILLWIAPSSFEWVGIFGRQALNGLTAMMLAYSALVIASPLFHAIINGHAALSQALGLEERALDLPAPVSP